MELRVRALETVLGEKGYIDPAALDVLIDTYQTKIGPRNGARVVARAWRDAAYQELAAARRHARRSPRSAIRAGRASTWWCWRTRREQHHMVVCTLCSCYPWPVLGLPPTWYKSAPYRSRAVRDPRGVLAEFGVDAARQHGDPRVGFDRRGALPRAADAAGRHRRLERRRARRAGDARFDDRHRLAVGAAGTRTMSHVHACRPRRPAGLRPDRQRA